MNADTSTVPIRILKVGLSIFLVYHLLAIFILPMGRGLVIRELGRYFVTYANLFNLNTSWQFFSPGPAPTFYLEYTYGYAPSGTEAEIARAEDEGLLTEGEPHFLPEKREDFGFSDFYNRKLFSMRFLSLTPERTAKFLVPWLCRQDSKAISVSLRQLYSEVQSVEKLRLDGSAEKFDEMTEANHQPPVTYPCERGAT